MSVKNPILPHDCLYEIARHLDWEDSHIVELFTRKHPQHVQLSAVYKKMLDEDNEDAELIESIDGDLLENDWTPKCSFCSDGGCYKCDSFFR